MLRLKKKETLIFWSSFAMLVSSSQFLALLCICKCIYICICIWVNILYIPAISLLVSSYKCNFFHFLFYFLTFSVLSSLVFSGPLICWFLLVNFFPLCILQEMLECCFLTTLSSRNNHQTLFWHRIWKIQIVWNKILIFSRERSKIKI